MTSARGCGSSARPAAGAGARWPASSSRPAVPPATIPCPTSTACATTSASWERGQRTLTDRYRLHYCKALGIPPAQSGSAPTGTHPGTLAPAASLAPALPAVPPAAELPVRVSSGTPHRGELRPSVPLAVAYRGIQVLRQGDSRSSERC